MMESVYESGVFALALLSSSSSVIRKCFFFVVFCFIFPLGFDMCVTLHSVLLLFIVLLAGVCLFFVVHPANWLNWPNGYQNGMYSSAFFLLLYCKFEALVRQFRLKISGCDGFFACYFIDVQVWAVTQVCRATHSCTRTHDMASFAVLLEESSNSNRVTNW